MELLATLLGAVIGLFAAWLGAAWTTRHARLERERQAGQALLRLAQKLIQTIEKEAKLAHSRPDEASFEAEHAVDALAEELKITLSSTNKKDRGPLDTLAQVVLDRAQIGPDPRVAALHAAWAVQDVVRASLNDERVAESVTKTVQDFRDQLAIVEEMRRDSDLAYEEWRREQLPAPESGSDPTAAL